MLRCEIPPAERAQLIHRGNRVHVHRVHVIDVVVHAADHRCKFRDHRDEETHVVQVVEDGPVPELRLLDDADEAQEELRRFLAFAKGRAEIRAGGRACHRVTGEVVDR